MANVSAYSSMPPPAPYGHWGVRESCSGYVGKTVTATFKDATRVTGRVLCAEDDLGTITISWEDGPRHMQCTFMTSDVRSLRVG